MDHLATARFTTYGPSHLAVLGVFAAGAVVLVSLGRAPNQRLVRRCLAVLIVAVQLPLQIRLLLPSHWSISTSLPLQLCDLAWIVAVLALWFLWPWAIATTYYWGLTLTLQAFFTPTLYVDFPSTRFIMFWGIHCFIVWSAIYLTWGLRLRPGWRGYGCAVAITLVWALAVFGVNAATGTNYGFLNRKPAGSSLLDVLGGWPWYLGVEVCLALAVWALITWPWTRLRARRAAQERADRVRTHD